MWDRPGKALRDPRCYDFKAVRLFPRICVWPNGCLHGGRLARIRSATWPRSIRQAPGAVRDAATARRIVVGILEEHGFVLRLPAERFWKATARRDAWELVP